MGADGVVRSREIVLWSLNEPPPSVPFKGTGIFLDGASALLCQGVEFASSQLRQQLDAYTSPGFMPAFRFHQNNSLIVLVAAGIEPAATSLLWDFSKLDHYPNSLFLLSTCPLWDRLDFARLNV